MDSSSFQPAFFTGTLFLFAVVGALMLLAPLLLGKLLRPERPNREKLAPYECGEPTIGSNFVQFDLRFYVVALLFIVFDVEVAFFFPWAVVFGKANTLANDRFGSPVVQSASVETQGAVPVADARQRVSAVLLSDAQAAPIESGTARTLMGLALVDLLIFFGVVLVGFAYVWKRGDLDWVRAFAKDRHGVSPTAA